MRDTIFQSRSNNGWCRRMEDKNSLLHPNVLMPSRRLQLSRSLSHKKRLCRRIFQFLVVMVLLVTIGINVVFIVETGRRLKYQDRRLDNQYGASGPYQNGLHADGSDWGWKSVEEPPKALEMVQADSKDAGSFGSLNIEVLSSQARVSVSVDGATILDDGDAGRNRGIHVLVLNQATGSVMAQRIFDTYSPHEDEAMVLFLNMVADGRIIVFAIKDEGTFQMKAGTKEALKRLGSDAIDQVSWRDMWALVTKKPNVGSETKFNFGESFSKSKEFHLWGSAVHLTAKVPLVSIEESQCNWEDTEINRRRLEFCNTVEGYGSVCNCNDPAPLYFAKPPTELLNFSSFEVPVAVIASNRPHYLFRMLRSLLSAEGADPSMVTVFIDGYYEEPLAVAKLFGLRGIQHTPLGQRNARISQHYKAALTATFGLYPNADYAIIVEEDLDVSPDFFTYFKQTLPLLEDDPTLYCVSAWNDQGYEHTSYNPRMLYRVETMPGLGWILKRSLFRDELEARWPTPDKMWDWDMWMRLPDIRKGRECIIPDVSRTFHFGASGLNMNSYFQDVYFKKRAFSTQVGVKLVDVENLSKDKYERHLRELLSDSTILDHTKSPCSTDFFPESSSGQRLVLYIQMHNPRDFKTWLRVAKCLRIWDLDARGYHRGLWRMHWKSNELIVIGVPFSPYSFFKPHDVTPLTLEPMSAIVNTKAEATTT